MRPKKKKAIRIVSIVLAAVILLGAAGVWGFFAFPYRGSTKNFAGSLELDAVLTRQQAQEDLNYLYEHLQDRHPIWLEDGSPIPEKVKAQYEAELAALGDSVTVLQLSQAAGRITALLGDGHTRAYWSNYAMERYADDITVWAEYGNPIAVNGVPVETIFERYLSVTSYELEFYAKNRFEKNGLASESVLRLCGIDTANGADMTFVTEQGNIDHHFTFVPYDQIKRPEQTQSDTNWVSYLIDKENNVGIFSLLSCVYDAEYREVLDAFFSEVFANGITNVAVDLRNNGGGNSMVANAFLRYIDVDSYRDSGALRRYGPYFLRIPDQIIKNRKKSQVFDGSLYVLTNISSFSAAKDFAMLVSDNGLGKIVGETSGNLPDSYGDFVQFETPNAKLAVIISYKKWFRIDKSKTGQPLTPDYEVPSAQARGKLYELIGAQG